MINIDKFCKAPFTSVVVDNDGTLLPCCEFMMHQATSDYKVHVKDFFYWWNNQLNDLRNIMTSGKQHNGCSYCFSKEVFGPSLRQRIAKDSTETVENLVENFKKNKLNLPNLIELRLGNYCNLKCFMCGPYASSSISSEYIKNKEAYNKLGIHFQIPKNPPWIENEDTKKIILNLVSNAKFLRITGGEPLINPAIFEILDHVDTNSSLSFNTNLTVVNDRLYDKFKKLKNINLQVSLDGIGTHNDYIRYGSTWKHIQNNIDKLKTLLNVEIEIYYILQHTSVYTLKNLLEWCEKEKIKLNLGTVYEKSVDGSGHLTINSVEPEEVNKFKNWFYKSPFFKSYPFVQKWLESYTYNESLNTRFKTIMDFLDNLRHTNFDKTFKNP